MGTARITSFPPGSEVKVYPQTNWTHGQTPPTGKPQGKSIGRVATDDSGATVSGLDAGTSYFAYAEVDGQDRYVQFTAKD